MPIAISALPPKAAQALHQLGEDLAIARIRRREPQRVWAKRLGVSVPTLIRLEHGDASVCMGIYATALWMLGRTEALGELADPQYDRSALEQDIRQIKKRRLARKNRHD